jgi:hypothetical protein
MQSLLEKESHGGMPQISARACVTSPQAWDLPTLQGLQRAPLPPGTILCQQFFKLHSSLNSLA